MSFGGSWYQLQYHNVKGHAGHRCAFLLDLKPNSLQDRDALLQNAQLTHQISAAAGDQGCLKVRSGQADALMRRRKTLRYYLADITCPLAYRNKVRTCAGERRQSLHGVRDPDSLNHTSSDR